MSVWDLCSRFKNESPYFIIHIKDATLSYISFEKMPVEVHRRKVKYFVVHHDTMEIVT